MQISTLPNGHSVRKNTLLKDENGNLWRCVSEVKTLGGPSKLQLIPEPIKPEMVNDGLETKDIHALQAWTVVTY